MIAIIALVNQDIFYLGAQLRRFLRVLRPATFIKQIEDPAVVADLYKYWRIRTFYSIYIGYVFFYLSRRSFASIINEINIELGISCELLGLCGTIFYIMYGISKFVSGMLSDNSNPRFFMSFGLIVTGILNILFSMTSSVWLMALVWGLNGVFQGFGWPPVAKQLTYWFSKKERGWWWSMCSTSHNVGGLLIPPIFAYLITHGAFGFIGWRFAMFVPGIVSILGGFFLINRLRDVPQSLGLPPIESYREHDTDIVEDKTSRRKTSFKQMFKEHILHNKFVWVMAVTYFFVYVVRTAVNDWSTIYLIRHGFDRIAAGIAVSWFEIGGFIGTLAAGYASDYFFEGKRVPFSALCALGMSLSIYVFGNINFTGDDVVLCNVLMSIMGFCIFGPQMLIGLAASEYVAKKAAGTANGFVGFCANAGAAAAGWPLGKLIDHSWSTFIMVLVFTSALCFLVLLPLIFTNNKNKFARQVGAASA